MSTSSYAYQHYLLKSISAQLQQSEIKQIALQPGVQSIYRITCHYADERTPDSVATLISSLTHPPQLTVIYAHQSQQAITIEYDRDTFKAFTSALSSLKYDRMDDQPGIPMHGFDLWLVERAAGSFTKDIMLAPALAEDTHKKLVTHIQEFVPQAVETAAF